MHEPKPAQDQRDPDLTVAGTEDCDPAATGPLGEALGARFRIGALLGRGGMGEVYAAEDLTLGRRVALKAIRPERRLAPAARERFQREARLLGRLDHAGICRIHDLIEAGDRDVLVLELITGRTLRTAGDLLNARERLDVALQIAATLEAAHAEGVVHRDLKPENIMLTPEGRIKVLDFGLARDLADGPEAEPAQETDADTAPFNADQTIGLSLALTDGVAVLGTPAYLSPEQAGGETATTASDMYAFGLVLQRLYTGQRAYEPSEDLTVILEQAREAKTLPLHGVDRDLARLIKQLEHRSPAARPTAAEARRQLAWIQRRPVRRARRWGAVAALTLILTAGIKYTLDLRHERRVADLHRNEAEGLVEFMIGDLRERLEPVGRLDVLDEVGDRALKYFAARSGEARTNDDQHRFARTMTQIGEVRLNQGDVDAAREAFGEARRTVQALVARDGTRGDWLLALGAAEFWLGSVDYMEGDLDAAEEAFLAYQVVARRLVALDDQKEEWQQELGYSHTNLAALHEARNQMPEALAELAEAVRIQRLLLDADPTDSGRRGDLINTLAWQSNVTLIAGDLATAYDRYGVAVAEAETLLVHDPDNVAHKELFSSLLHLEAKTSEYLGQGEAALALYLRSLQIAEDLTRHDPENVTWRFSMAVSQISVGSVYRRAGRDAEAAAHLRRGAELCGELVASEPENIEYLLNLSAAFRGLADLELNEAALAAAERQVDQALAVARQGLELNRERDALEVVATALVLKGEIAQQAQDAGLAREAWLEASALLAPLVANSRAITTQDPWLRLLTHLDQKDRAREVAQGLQAMGYARQDYLLFCREHGIELPVRQAAGREG